jgi:hypothetical protein
MPNGSKPERACAAWPEAAAENPSLEWDAFVEFAASKMICQSAVVFRQRRRDRSGDAMSPMRKRIIAALLAGTLVFGAAACDSGNDGDEVEQELDEEEAELEQELDEEEAELEEELEEELSD